MKELDQVSIIYHNNLPPEIVGSFVDECRTLDVPTEDRSIDPQPYNGLEEYLPAAVTIFLAKPFIDAFLKKAGEESYVLFKASLVKLLGGIKKLSFSIFSSGELKVDPNYPFSRGITIYSIGINGKNFKFLISEDLQESELRDVVEELAGLVASGFEEFTDIQLQ